MVEKRDPHLDAIIAELTNRHRCHTILLYGSRARGLTTPTSDYDVLGVCRRGEKTRIAQKRNGAYWDVFVYPEKDLRELREAHAAWKNARIVFGEGPYGRNLLKRIQRLVRRPYVRQPRYEIEATKAWAQKELERSRATDIQGLFRRSEFLYSLVEHYFFVRQKRFWGPKESFSWLEKHDPRNFRLVRRALAHPTNLSFLKAAAESVYDTRLT